MEEDYITTELVESDILVVYSGRLGVGDHVHTYVKLRPLHETVLFTITYITYVQKKK
jgi:hypothetical protein